MSEAPPMRDLLGNDTPSNWGRWGPDDEVGALNYLDAGEVLLSHGERYGQRGERGHEPFAPPVMEGVERGKGSDNAPPPHRNPQR